MLPLGTRVNHSGHGNGTIVDYNGTSGAALEYLLSERGSAALQSVPIGLAPGITSAFYSADRYPYVVQYDSGYRDVYTERELVVIN